MVLTVEQVAELLLVSTATVRSLIKSGALPAFRVGSQWRIKREDLDQYMSSGSVTAPKREN